jgi:hypothetical protein
MSKQTELSEQEIVDAIEEAVAILSSKAEGDAKMTKHIAAGVVTPIMLAKTVDVPGPMIYTYVGKGFISGTRDKVTDRVLIEVNEAIRFIAKRVAKARQATKNVEVELTNA